MIAINFTTARGRLKDFCDRVTDRGETVIVTRKAEKNVVIISEERFNELEKAERNAAYLGKLERGLEQVHAGLGNGTTKGVDADLADRVTKENLDEAAAFAKAFAGKMNAVVAITGAIDIVADAEKAYCIYNGRPEMSSITGTGCQLSALTAAFVTANQEQPLEAAAAAVCAMGLAGETAYARLSELDGNATYRNYIIDAIYRMNGEALEAGAKFEVR